MTQLTGNIVMDERGIQSKTQDLEVIHTGSMDRDVYHAGGLSRARVMLTIHNMDNSGECRQDEFAYTGAHIFLNIPSDQLNPDKFHVALRKALQELPVTNTSMCRHSWRSVCYSGQGSGRAHYWPQP